MKNNSCLTEAESDVVSQILGGKCCLLTQMKHAFHHRDKCVLTEDSSLQQYHSSTLHSQVLNINTPQLKFSKDTLLTMRILWKFFTASVYCNSIHNNPVRNMALL